MPVRNEAEFIAASLTAVLEQDYPPDRMEVLVVDGMSDDGTRAIVADVSSRYPDVSVSLLDNPRRITSGSGVQGATSLFASTATVRSPATTCHGAWSTCKPEKWTAWAAPLKRSPRRR